MKLRQALFAAGVAEAVIVKLFPGVRAVTMYVRPGVVLQVTPRSVPSEESSDIRILDPSVTCLLYTSPSPRDS